MKTALIILSIAAVTTLIYYFYKVNEFFTLSNEVASVHLA